jgi:hypothetical protein
MSGGDDHTLGSGPVQPEYAERMRAVALAIRDFFNDGADKEIGFILMVFPLNDGGSGRCNYMSNARREDVVTLLKEQLRYFEGQSDTLEGRA